MEPVKTSEPSLPLHAGCRIRNKARPLPRHGRRTQRGVALVEFAIVLPLLLLLLFGIIEIGFVLYDKAVITNASRAAARQAVAFGEDSTGAAVYMPASSAIGIATNGLSAMLISPTPTSAATVTITPTNGCTGSGTGTPLTVAVSYPFTGLNLSGSSVDPLASSASAKHVLTLNASTTMNCE